MFTLLLAPGHIPFQSQPAGEVRLLSWPELKLDQPDSFELLDEAIDNLFGYDWLLFKNEHAADFFLRRFAQTHTTDELDQIRVMASGDAATERLGRSQIHVDLTWDRFSAADPLVALQAYAGDVAGLNLLAPSAGLHRERFEEQLTDRGARVDDVVAYRTVADRSRLTELITLLLGGGIDSIAFTGPLELNQFVQVMDSDDLERMLSGVSVACVGEDTFATAVRFGLTPRLIGTQTDQEALIRALVPSG